MSSPGPHAFLLVIKPGLFTEEEIYTVEMFFRMFGREVERYMIVVFTCADQLEGPIDDLIQGSHRLKNLMRMCSNRKYAIDNKTKSKRETQVRELIKLIDIMIEKNGGSYYSNEMYEENANLLAEQEEKLRFEHEKREREKVKAIEDEVTKKYEGQLSKLRQKEDELKNNIEATQKELEMVEARLGKSIYDIYKVAFYLEITRVFGGSSRCWMQRGITHFSNAAPQLGSTLNPGIIIFS